MTALALREPATRLAGASSELKLRELDRAAGTAGANLHAVNGVVAAAVGTWGLPARVRRLALPSLLYGQGDLGHMHIWWLDEPGTGALAVAAWEETDSGSEREIMLHGLYVLPRRQGEGLGSRLLSLVEQWGKAHGYDGVALRAWGVSEAFFRGHGYGREQRDGSSTANPKPMRKAIA